MAKAAARPPARDQAGEEVVAPAASAASAPAAPAAAPVDEAQPAALAVADLSFAYRGRPVLDRVAFRVERGVFTALLGPNGAGKTTLFSLVTRLFDAPGGTVRILGRDAGRDGADALAPLGVVFQSETLDADLTVRQNLRYFAALHGLGTRTADARIREELEAIGVLDRIDDRVRDLNGGHRRRVEIARALLHRPELLLLDEATVGLDVPTRRAIVARVHRLARERHIGVLWTTHLIDEVEPDDALVVLVAGRVVATGDVAGVVAATAAADLSAAYDRLTAPGPGRDPAAGSNAP
ncbi:ATP-binding cassette domain-containing protein [Oharaeibacter diazotrophicus]|uniref:ATP-binding cassette domain-containing protein n=1 Tax=Oharaeibacter diazotrophicus TaxID=1920512 RepID=UPI0013F678E1|nr:ATP-binding cassette domain-containing protein [Oharaeibacter diazotrophicus]